MEVDNGLLVEENLRKRVFFSGPCSTPCLLDGGRCAKLCPSELQVIQDVSTLPHPSFSGPNAHTKYTPCIELGPNCPKHDMPVQRIIRLLTFAPACDPGGVSGKRTVPNTPWLPAPSNRSPSATLKSPKASRCVFEYNYIVYVHCWRVLEGAGMGDVAYIDPLFKHPSPHRESNMPIPPVVSSARQLIPFSQPAKR